MKQDFSNFDTKSSSCYSISELTKMIQVQLEEGFPPLWVQGELSNFTAHASGHWYFTLKDSSSQLKAVMFRYANAKLKGFYPKAGMEVKVYGKISVYNARGEYQIICEAVEECGKGKLQEEFERRKQALRKKGVFDRKLALPLFPKHIVIISSATGAAIQDILNILKRRSPGIQVTLVPALVQGEQAEESLLQAMDLAKQLKDADILIITRGGGSLEDLWPFNSEKLARQVAIFPIPVISAVGHEIDFSISDFAADLRAPTPSTAAELAVQNTDEWIDKIQKIKMTLIQNIQRELQYSKSRVIRIKQILISPQRKLQDTLQKIDELSQYLSKAFLRHYHLKAQSAKHLRAVLKSLDPFKVLNRGYAAIQKKGKTIQDASHLKIGDDILIQFATSNATAHITKINLNNE